MGYEQEGYWPLEGILKIWWDETILDLVDREKSSPISYSLKEPPDILVGKSPFVNQA